MWLPQDAAGFADDRCATRTCVAFKNQSSWKLQLWLLRPVSRSRKSHRLVVKNQAFRHVSVLLKWRPSVRFRTNAQHCVKTLVLYRYPSVTNMTETGSSACWCLWDRHNVCRCQSVPHSLWTKWQNFTKFYTNVFHWRSLNSIFQYKPVEWKLH